MGTKYLIDTITREGLKKSFLTPGRYEKPRPGDPVKLGDGIIGMVDAGAGWIEQDGSQVMVCKGVMGAFMGDGFISISGGPFEVVDIDRLKPTFELYAAKFWIWASYPQGSGGVNIWIERPLCELKGENEGH
jgi:hypothetical protein